ncbi:hypothetical protein N9R34_00175 [Candidatus Thioglobus sp.]|jgi:hypothetical protein|nr:hypothetical protein [Candidatus Thioglobus sp.]|tara:strand:- start:2764 stop:3072 length:309 start_codon:yes stop_codon:yes gene_type:complete
MSAKFKFDGDKLTKKNSSIALATVRGDIIFAKASYSSKTAKISGNKICEGTSSKVVANVGSGYLYAGSTSSKKICKIKDIEKTIDGNCSEEVKAALWFYFCQ